MQLEYMDWPSGPCRWVGLVAPAFSEESPWGTLWRQASQSSVVTVTWCSMWSRTISFLHLSSFTIFPNGGVFKNNLEAVLTVLLRLLWPSDKRQSMSPKPPKSSTSNHHFLAQCGSYMQLLNSCSSTILYFHPAPKIEVPGQTCQCVSFCSIEWIPKMIVWQTVCFDSFCPLLIVSFR